ncbi:hypothetical protein [Psychroserpens sp. MEBiC05023]
MLKELMYKTWSFPMYVVIIVLIQLVLMFHGFDICDEGFSLTFYQQFFNAPENVEYCFVYWLSGLIGGLWYQLFETGGILWFRVLTVVFNTATLLLCYQILKNHIKLSYIMIGLAMVLFVNDFGFLAFYHNHITTFLTVLSVYVLVKGIQQQKLMLLGLSGLILGVNIFARLPNITLLIFLLAIPYASFILRKKALFLSIKPMLVLLFGSIVGIALVVIMMYGLNQWHIMENAFSVLFSLGKTEDSGHNFITLIRVIKNNYIAIFYETSKLVVVISILLVLHRFLKDKAIIKYVVPLVALLSFVMLFAKGDIYMVYVLGFIGTLGIMFTKQKTEQIKIIAFLALLTMIFLPLGSGGGVHSSGYICIWLATPFFFKFISQITTISLSAEIEHVHNSIQIEGVLSKYLFSIIAISYFGYKGYSISQEAYFDKGNRLSKTAVIDNKFTNGIYTTNERAKVINDVLKELENHVEPNDYMFVYDSAPMLHFLTETRPYTYNPWVWIYDHVSFEQKLKLAETNIVTLPIIVQQKFTAIWEFSEPIDDYLAEDKPYSNTYDPGRAKAMNSFIERNAYKIIWSNDYFNIYKSSK